MCGIGKIGNEIFGDWQIGCCDARAYCERYRLFAQAIRRLDPSLKLVACGGGPLAWNRTLIEEIGGEFDLLSIHYYHGFDGRPTAGREQQYRYIVSMPEALRHVVRETQRFAKEKGILLKVALTEFNTMYYPVPLRHGRPMEHTMEAAVANAGAFNELLRCSDVVDISNISDLCNGWMGGIIRVGDFCADQPHGVKTMGRTVYGSASYHAMKLYAQAPLSSLVTVHTRCDCYHPQALRPSPLPEYGELPELDAVCCTDKTGKILTCFVVNRALEEYEAELDAGFHPDSCELTLIAAQDIDDYNRSDRAECILPKRRDAAAQRVVRLSLPPASICRVTLRRP